MRAWLRSVESLCYRWKLRLLRSSLKWFIVVCEMTSNGTRLKTNDTRWQKYGRSLSHLARMRSYRRRWGIKSGRIVDLCSKMRCQTSCLRVSQFKNSRVRICHQLCVYADSLDAMLRLTSQYAASKLKELRSNPDFVVKLTEDGPMMRGIVLALSTYESVSQKYSTVHLGGKTRRWKISPNFIHFIAENGYFPEWSYQYFRATPL